MAKENIADVIVQDGALGHPVVVWSKDVIRAEEDFIVEEVPVALVYNGVSQVVMMVSPLALEAFALGFSLTEGIIDRPDDIYTIDIVEQENGIEIRLMISNRCFSQLKDRRRNLMGRSGCGICGAESLEQVRLSSEVVSAEFRLSHAAINKATSDLVAHQPLQELTGGVHGAAWCDDHGNIVLITEDVGRHNALDKLIGSLWPGSTGTEQSTINVLQQPGFLLISSRASYEIVQKAAKAGIAVVVAVSAPTSLAIEIANEKGITLVGFSRFDRHVVYTNCQRLNADVNVHRAGEDV